jgi:hypothetical protein
MSKANRERRKERQRVDPPAKPPMANLLEEVILSQPERPCLLCGGPGTHACAFCPHPENQAVFRAPPGKLRILLYRVCCDCANKPDRDELVERVLWNEAASPERN